MAVTQMSDMINPQVMGDMIDAKIEAMLKITPYAKLDTTLQGVPGDTKTVPSWNYIGDAVDVAEGSEVGLSTMTASTTTFTIKKAMIAVGLTQESVGSGLGNPIGQAERQLAKSIASKVDNDVLSVLLKATKTKDLTSAVISYNSIVDGVGEFEEEEITDKVMFVHPAQITTLRKDVNFISADKYNNNVMMSGEIGMIATTRVVPSKKVPLVKYTPCDAGTTNALEVVPDDTASLGTTKVEAKTVNGHTWDATNKVIKSEYTGNETTTLYVLPVDHNYYFNPIVKLEPASAETEYTEDELPAVTIFLKKDTQTDAEWKPRTQTHEITSAKYYGVALTNGAKVVLASTKA